MSIFLFYFFLEHFGHDQKMFKSGFSFILSKSDLGGGDILCEKKILKKPNILKYAQVLVVTCPKLNSVAALLFPPPHVKRRTDLSQWAKSIFICWSFRSWNRQGKRGPLSHFWPSCNITAPAVGVRDTTKSLEPTNDTMENFRVYWDGHHNRWYRNTASLCSLRI